MRWQRPSGGPPSTGTRWPPSIRPLADAVRAGDRWAFRNGLLAYKDGLRLWAAAG